MVELTRDEAFNALIDAITELQRNGVLDYGQAVGLQRLIVPYGSACAREARELAWQTLRPSRQLVRQVDGVEWLE